MPLSTTSLAGITSFAHVEAPPSRDFGHCASPQAQACRGTSKRGPRPWAKPSNIPPASASGRSPQTSCRCIDVVDPWTHSSKRKATFSSRKSRRVSCTSLTISFATFPWMTANSKYKEQLFSANLCANTCLTRLYNDPRTRLMIQLLPLRTPRYLPARTTRRKRLPKHSHKNMLQCHFASQRQATPSP